MTEANDYFEDQGGSSLLRKFHIIPKAVTNQPPRSAGTISLQLFNTFAPDYSAKRFERALNSWKCVFIIRSHISSAISSL